MFSQKFLKQYRILRNKYNFTGSEAHKYTPNIVEYEKLLSEKKVKIEYVPDECFDIRDYEFNSQKQEDNFIAKVNSEGVYGVIAYVFWNENWERVWDIWGFIGNSFEGSVYEIYAKLETIRLLDSFREEEAEQLAQRATYAGF